MSNWTHLKLNWPPHSPNLLLPHYPAICSDKNLGHFIGISFLLTLLNLAGWLALPSRYIHNPTSLYNSRCYCNGLLKIFPLYPKPPQFTMQQPEWSCHVTPFAWNPAMMPPCYSKSQSSQLLQGHGVYDLLPPLCLLVSPCPLAFVHTPGSSLDFHSSSA